MGWAGGGVGGAGVRGAGVRGAGVRGAGVRGAGVGGGGVWWGGGGGGFLFHSFQPLFFSKTSNFPRGFCGFLERRIHGKNGKVTPRLPGNVDTI